MNEVGVGIIGTGYIATTCHGPAVTAVPQARLAAALSTQAWKAREFLDSFDAAQATDYDDIGAFLDDPDVTLVVVASPDRLHFHHALASLRAGKHVLVEKPMAGSDAEARQLLDAAAQADRVLAVGYHLRCHRGHIALRQKIQAGGLGDIRHMRLMWSYPTPTTNWRAHDDLGQWWSLGMTGTHLFDLARWFTNDMHDWAGLAAVISHRKWDNPHDEAAVIAAELASGATVEILSSVQIDEYMRIEIFGDQATAICEDTLGSAGAGRIRVNDAPIAFTPGSPFIPQLEGVLTAIADRSTPPADGAVGLRAVNDLLRADQ